MAKISPLPQIPQKHKVAKSLSELVNEMSYKIELQFNNKAELVNVDYPGNLSLVKVNEHVAVAIYYLSQKLSEGG